MCIYAGRFVQGQLGAGVNLQHAADDTVGVSVVSAGPNAVFAAAADAVGALKLDGFVIMGAAADLDGNLRAAVNGNVDVFERALDRKSVV